jgi:16S rRNA (cytidine1402-2'-O)-methyltransferase
LRESGLIACEDTRRTRKLLEHYSIRTPTISYHEHNEDKRVPQLLEKLRAGINLALVADAGTPLVSDPGYRLVAQAIREGIRIEPVPGASALLAALAASGMPSDQFHFAGFLPAKAAQRRKALERLKDTEVTLVLYEAPHRVLETLDDVEAILGPRPVVLARELTKLHEEFLRGTSAEWRAGREARAAVKGEITLLIGGGRKPPEDDTPIPQAVEEAVRTGLTRMEAIKSVARRRGMAKRAVYTILESQRSE